MTPVLLSLLLAANVTYTCPKDGDRGCEVTDWSKSPRVYTATNDVPVRERPDAEAPVVAKLRFGVPVKILSASSALATVAGRADRWYRVASDGKGGYVFGDGLTAARFEDDFDGDGEKELATVAFTSDFDIRVRFWEPTSKRETHVDVQPAGEAYLSMRGGHAAVAPVTRRVAGVPLVHVATRVEACSDLADYWVSYSGEAPVLALELSGLVDPPNFSTYQVQFTKQGAVVKRERAEEPEAPPVKTTELWPRDGLVFTRPKAAAE